MTRPALDERDPQPERPWQETSSPGIRHLALQQVAAAVRKAKESRKKPAGAPADGSKT